MRETEYLDPVLFPLTTQAVLTLAQQMQIDAFNYDGIKVAVARGHEWDDKQQARWKELGRKVAAFPLLRRKIKSAQA